MKLKIIPVDGDPSFEVDVRKKSYGINNYLIDNKLYRAFQYDCYDRPENYVKEYAQTQTFHGFLVGRGKNKTIECYIEVIY